MKNGEHNVRALHLHRPRRGEPCIRPLMLRSPFDAAFAPVLSLRFPKYCLSYETLAEKL